jgi:hypothetical protein
MIGGTIGAIGNEMKYGKWSMLRLYLSAFAMVYALAFAALWLRNELRRSVTYEGLTTVSLKEIAIVAALVAGYATFRATRKKS